MIPSEEDASEGAKIKLNIFDLVGINKIFRCCHLGIYHSSVVIDEKLEYYFGFAAYHYTGIDSPEKIDHLPSSMDGEFYMSIDMGTSPYSYTQCKDIVSNLKGLDRWLSDSYNFLFHNCNTFTYELCDQLLNHQYMDKYPKWLFRGENVGKFIFITSVAYIFDIRHVKIPSLGKIPEEKKEHKKEKKEPHIDQASEQASEQAQPIENTKI